MGLSIKMFKEISLSSVPFAEGNVAALKKMAIVFFVEVAVEFVMRFIGGIIISGDLDFQVNILSLTLAVVFMGVAYIVNYGVALQTEHDTTL